LEKVGTWGSVFIGHQCYKLFFFKDLASAHFERKTPARSHCVGTAPSSTDDPVQVRTKGTLTLARTGTQTAESTDATLNHLNLYDLLLLCLRSRDELSWTEFIRRSQPVIAGVVVKAVRRWTRPSVSLVDDLVQDTYVKLCANDFRALRRYVCRHDSAIFGFLKVVALNVVQDHFRLSYSQKRGCGKDGEQLEDAAILRVTNSSTKDMERRVLVKEIEDSLTIYSASPPS